jgi:hypothetical protein
MHDNWDWERYDIVRILWDLFWREGVLTNVGALKGIDYGPKQLWGSEDVSTVGGLGVHCFSLFNFLGFGIVNCIWPVGLKRGKPDSLDSPRSID